MAEEPDAGFMKQTVSVGYAMKPSPPQREFARALADRRIVGHRCPRCGKVYVPPKGYCPLCVVETNPDRDAVEVADRGVITSFTVITPIQYKGQQEKSVYAVASILLDGADTTMGQQRIGDVPPEEIRTGMRVEAEWKSDLAGTGSAQGMMEGPIAYWGPSGEPDATREEIEAYQL